jgi:hypothetical protein
MPIPNSFAYTLCTLRKIEAGESITVNYAADGSYFGGRPCGCATCNPHQPPVATKRPLDLTKFLPNPNGKRSRRGGKRAKRRKPNPSESPAMNVSIASSSTTLSSE